MQNEIVEQNKFNLITSEWFYVLIEDCKTTIVEKRYRVAIEVLEMKWQLGDRILQDTGNFERAQIYGRQIIVTVSKALDCSEREIYRCIQFRKKYPELNDLPEGKNITWHKIVNQYLPEKSKSEEDNPEQECQHEKVEILIRCARCRERLAFRVQDKNSVIDLASILTNRPILGDKN